MIKFISRTFVLVLLLAIVQFTQAKTGVSTNSFDKNSSFKLAKSRTDEAEKNAIAETRKIVEEIVADSYPELKKAQIKVKTFNSNADYFRSRFTFSRFLTFRNLHYLILVNPKIYESGAPREGIRAIIAHELAHIAYYERHNCFELLGLVALQSNSFTARFERGADLQAIKRGYGEGLKIYREWLYKNIQAKNLNAKKRDYFSPEEIDLILEGVRQKPELINYFIENVPRNSDEIKKIMENQNEAIK